MLPAALDFLGLAKYSSKRPDAMASAPNWLAADIVMYTSMIMGGRE
jgi:hypothetical protein